ncbi:MAG: AI-2E family transporter [Candidatus Peribacteraceae bacterium]|nr:AI-2E family transporter [Candidatus Peribacteraceae bacterium]
MAKKPSPADSFKSIQILSAKAQSLWTKAKERMHATHPAPDAAEPVTPPAGRKNVMKIEISAVTAAKVTCTIILVLSVAWLLIAIRDSLLILFLSFFIAIVIDYNVRWLERWNVPRSIAVWLIYLVFLSVIVFLIASLIPIVAAQLQELARYINNQADSFLINPNVHLPFVPETVNGRLTDIVQNTLQNLGIKDRASALLQFGQKLSTVAESSIGYAAQLAGGVFGFFVNLILILFLSFFIQLEREKIIDFFRSILPADYRSYFDNKADAIYQKMSQWFRGQLILCISIGVLVFIALKILGMPYALTLALLAAFTEFIPYAGPIFGAIPAVIIAFSQFGFVWGLVVAGVYYVIQLCENNILVPLIMKHAVGLSPISIMFGMLVGVSFPSVIHPVIGIILAVPATAVLTIFVHDFYVLRRRK